MKYMTVITALLISFALPVAADMTPVTETHELAVSDVRLPQSELGTIGFKPCSDCAYETRRVDAATVWEIDGTALTLDKFRRRVAGITNPGETAMQVQIHLESNRVTRVWILIV